MRKIGLKNHELLYIARREAKEVSIPLNDGFASRRVYEIDANIEEPKEEEETSWVPAIILTLLVYVVIAIFF